MRDIVCIVCPKGCCIHITDKGIEGAGCAKGKAYTETELTSPERVLTSTVAVAGGIHPRLPVKTAVPVPKESQMHIMKELGSVTVEAPVVLGAIILRNAAGTGVPVVATRTMPRMAAEVRGRK